MNFHPFDFAAQITNSVEWVKEEETGIAINQLKKEGYYIVVVEQVEEATEIQKFQNNKPIALIFGHEVNGIIQEIQKVTEPFLGHIGRSHILHLPPGGYFPPHRDLHYMKQQNSLRVLVPLKGCNPPDMYFMYENKPLHFEHGRAYFLNTNKSHNLFSFKDSYMLVLNIKTSEEVYQILGDNFQAR